MLLIKYEFGISKFHDRFMNLRTKQSINIRHCMFDVGVGMNLYD